MTRDEAIELANDMAFMACIWIDDGGNEVNDLVKLIQSAYVVGAVAEAAKFAKGAKIQIPTYAMEQEFANHHRIGYEAGYRVAKEQAAHELAAMRAQLDALLKTMTDSLHLRANSPMKLLANAESFEAGRVMEREAMVAEAAKQGWAMKNEDPFEDYVRDIADICARRKQ